MKKKKKIEIVENFIKKNKKINLLADLGCNDGKFSKVAIQNSKKCYWFDFDQKY